MLEKIEKLTQEIKSLHAKNAEELEALRIKYLSRKGELQALMADFKNVAAEDKKTVGIKVNELKQLAFDTINGLNEMSGIRNYFNDFYAADTSKKIRAVQKAKGERGEPVGTTAPYGYLKNPDYKGNQEEHPWLIVDPESAPIVRRIFEMYASGVGIRRICATFEEERILAPGVYLFRKTGTKAFHPNLAKPYRWTLTTVRRMLSNQFYCGDTVNFKTYSKSNKLKKRLKNDSSKVLIFKDTHEPIVDRSLFETVQKHFAGRKRPDKMGEMDKFAGYLYCGDCGRRMYLHRGKNYPPREKYVPVRRVSTGQTQLYRSQHKGKCNRSDRS